MEPFKDLIGSSAVRTIRDAVGAAWPAFEGSAFEAASLEGIEALELKARVAHVAAALRRHLPAPWPHAVDVLIRALPPPLEGESGLSSGLAWWPVVRVVEDFGLDDPESSLPALREMTRRSSAEFAIRPFLVRHPAAAWAALERWSTDPDLHVRRLVSEGTRPRLPWGLRLRHPPARALPLLDRLVDDPSAYVRRSVANHLGDWAKEDPDGAIGVAARWLAVRSDRLPTVRHALRHPLKAGHPAALQLVGELSGPVAVGALVVSPDPARIGDRVTVRADVTASVDGPVRVDLVWRWPTARGDAGRVFRGSTRTVRAGETWAFAGSLSLAPVSTRPSRPGAHRVWLRVGGADHGPAGFTVEPSA